VLFQRHRRPTASHITKGGRNFRQTEIENLGVTALCDEGIGRFDVPVDDASRMSRIQRIRNLDSERQHNFDLERLASDALL
jgi:hypothetical protein